MKSRCILVAVLLSCISRKTECKQVFTCTRDTVGNITEIKQGTKCVFSWAQDFTSMSNTVDNWFIEEISPQLEYPEITGCRGENGINLKIDLTAQSPEVQKNSIGFQIGFEIPYERRVYHIYRYIIIFPRSYNKSEEAIFQMNNLNDIHWETYKSLQFKPIKWDYAPDSFYQDLHNCTKEDTNEPYIESSSVTSGSSYQKTSVVVIVLTLLLVIAMIGFFVYTRQRKFNKLANISILVSSGDLTSSIGRTSNKFASHLKSSGQFSKVFFNGWLSRNDTEKNLEKLHDALSISTYVIIFASQFAKTSYEKFISQGENALWKDEFVVGVSKVLKTYKSLLLNDQLVLGNRKVFVLYSSFQSASDSDVLHEDFVHKSNGCFDVSKKEEEEKFYCEFSELHGKAFSFYPETIQV